MKELNITLKFQKEQNWKYDKEILQGILYNIIMSAPTKKTPKQIKNIHDSKYTPFNFSNIFYQKGNFKANKKYYLRFRSIDKEIIEMVYKGFLINNEIDFGSKNKITIVDINKKEVRPISSGEIIKTQTPIVTSLYKKICEENEIKYKVKKGRPLYYNSKIGNLDIFIKSINKNITNKYISLLERGYIDRKNNFDREIINKKSENNKKFNNYAAKLDYFKKMGECKDVMVNYKGGKIVGTKWKGLTATDNKNLLKILNKVKLVGLGEKTSIGFGFID